MRTAVTEIRLATIAEVEAREDLTTAHWEEVAKHKELMVLAPDWERYAALERLGMLLTLGAFTEDNEMVGYSTGILTTHIHYKDLRYYQNDALFLSPEVRRSRLGLRLIQSTEDEAAKRGARFVCWHAKQGSALDSLLSKKGYGVQDIIYARKV